MLRPAPRVPGCCVRGSLRAARPWAGSEPALWTCRSSAVVLGGFSLYLAPASGGAFTTFVLALL